MQYHAPFLAKIGDDGLIRNNILRATAWRGNHCQTSTIWQYDYGQVLVIDGLDLPEYYEVHFTDSTESTAIIQIGSADGVAIPDDLLRSGNHILAYIYLHTGDADGETVKTIHIPVNKRTEPGDQEPTPEQQTAIEEIIVALNEAVQRAEDAKETLMNASAEARTLETGADATAEYTEGTFVFGLPRGEKGEPGEQGIKGDTGNAGVYVGEEEPTDPEAQVWLNPEGEAYDLSLYALKTDLPVTVLSPAGNTHTLQPWPATYNFGEVAALDVTVTPASMYRFMFSCPDGAATRLTMYGIAGVEGDQIEADGTYLVDVWAGIAMIKKLEVVPVV